MSTTDELLKRNSDWADENQDIIAPLAKGQSPETLWIGCADSRVPPAVATQSDPGELFVLRNVANVFLPTDAGSLAVLQYAIDHLKVKNVVVCGHYSCGGVQAALEGKGDFGLIHPWLASIKDVHQRHEGELADLQGVDKLSRLCELNVKAQVERLAGSSIVQRAWNRGQPVSVIGWIHSLATGRLTDLGFRATSSEDVPPIFRLE
tara:strand:+ start:1484 stop:2101 length:618 start_codon:yes stop_codon:yes gene_type:complete